MSRLGPVVRRSAGKRKDPGSVSRLGLVVRRSTGKRKDHGSMSQFGLVVKRSADKRKDPSFCEPAWPGGKALPSGKALSW